MSHLPPANDDAAPTPKANAFLWRTSLRAGRTYLLTALLGSAAAAALSAALAYTLGGTIALALDAAADPDLLTGPLLMLLGLGLARALMSWLADWNGGKAGAALRATLRHNLFRAFMLRGPIVLGQHTSGELTTLLMEKVEACDAYAARYLPLIAAAIFGPAVSATLLAALIGWHIWVLLVGVILLPFFMAVFGIMTAKASRAQFVALTRMGSLFADRLRNLTLLRTFAASTREQAHLAQVADDFRARTMRVLRLAFLNASVMDVVVTLCFIIMAVQLVHQQVSLHIALPALLLTLEFFAPLRALMAAYHDRASALTAGSELMGWLATSPHQETGGLRVLPQPINKPSLELMKVSYTYPGRHKPALQDYSLRIEGGEFVALTGPSGAGKSTIVHLLIGFIQPQQGAIALAQHALSTLDPTQRAQAFAWVGQRTRLFHATLAENIALGQDGACRESIMAAARAARLDTLIDSLPHGLDTIIGAYGFGLSGGQAQRVALARAFLRNAPVLLLDEPTAGLDSETAQDLLITIKALAQSRTVVMVTHDAQALKMAERIIMVREVAHA